MIHSIFYIARKLRKHEKLTFAAAMKFAQQKAARWGTFGILIGTLLLPGEIVHCFADIKDGISELCMRKHMKYMRRHGYADISSEQKTDFLEAVDVLSNVDRVRQDRLLRTLHQGKKDEIMNEFALNEDQLSILNRALPVFRIICPLYLYQ